MPRAPWLEWPYSANYNVLYDTGQALLSGTTTFSVRTTEKFELYRALTCKFSQIVTKVDVGQLVKQLNVKPCNRPRPL